MDNKLTMISLVVGVIMVVIALIILILRVAKGKYNNFKGVLSLLLIGFLSIAIGITSMIPDFKNGVLKVVSTENYKKADENLDSVPLEKTNDEQDTIVPIEDSNDEKEHVEVADEEVKKVTQYKPTDLKYPILIATGNGWNHLLS